jgi:GNAT superfamily N-acetyltransferase
MVQIPRTGALAPADVAWLDPADLDPRDVAGVAALLQAAAEVDSPHQPAPTARMVSGRLRKGFDGQPPATAVARDALGRIVGVLELDLPQWDNTHAAQLDVTVEPTGRRRGLGWQLVEIGCDRARTAGRRLVLGYAFDGTAGAEALPALGFTRVYDEVQRRQRPFALDRERLAQLHREAAERAAAYELLRLPGVLPDDLLPAVARLAEAINDAPTDAMDIEDESLPPERLRGREQALAAIDRRIYRVVARERATGALAGHTVVVIDGERPAHAYQYDTAVAPAHRGHRLGLLLKAAMLDWLGEEEPQVRTIDTWNAASNDHMVRVNEILGYEVLATGGGWQRAL